MTTVRDATADDVDVLVALEMRAFPSGAWSRTAIEAEVARIGESRHVLVAVDDAGGVVGYAALLYTGGLADVQRVAVDPGARRRGIGAALLGGVLELAEEVGCERALLEVAAGNVAALALYAEHGFVEITRRPRYYADGDDAVVLQRQMTRRT